MKKFIVIRRSNLEPVANIYCKDEWIKGKRLMLISLGGWCAALIFLSIIMWQCISYNKNVYKLKNEYKEQLLIRNDNIDSLKFSIEKIERSEVLMRRCYEVQTTKCPKPTHDNIWEFIKKCDPLFPDIIMTQAVLESDCGKSNVAKRCNNLFGMKKPYSRELRCDIYRNNKKEIYAEYLDWRYSIIDRILWDKWLFRNYKTRPTIDEYMEVIDNVYNTETDHYATNVYTKAEKYRKLIN